MCAGVQCASVTRDLHSDNCRSLHCNSLPLLEPVVYTQYCTAHTGRSTFVCVWTWQVTGCVGVWQNMVCVVPSSVQRVTTRVTSVGDSKHGPHCDLTHLQAFLSHLGV